MCIGNTISHINQNEFRSHKTAALSDFVKLYAPTLYNSTQTDQYWLSSHSPIIYLSAIDVRVQFNLFTDNLNYRVIGGGALLYFTKFDTEEEQEDKIYIDSSSTGQEDEEEEKVIKGPPPGRRLS